MKIEKIVFIIVFFIISIISCGDKNNEEQDPVPPKPSSQAQKENAQTGVAQPEDKKIENLQLCQILNNATHCYSYINAQSTALEEIEPKILNCNDMADQFVGAIEIELNHSIFNLDGDTLSKIVDQLDPIRKCSIGLSDDSIVEDVKKYAQCVSEQLTKIKSILKCN